MGGRGGKSGFYSTKTLDPRAKKTVIETYYRKSGIMGSHYGDSVMQATAGKDGEINFDYAEAHFKNKFDKANTQDVTFEISHGSVTHFNNGRTTFYGINWENVKSVTGNTYPIRGELKDKGFSWDGKGKKWVKK
nr:MAG TPA: hypothetical protein [Caudoviricetes sp.]